MKPQVEAYAADQKNEVKFLDLNLGQNREFIIELGISGIPTFLFFRDGHEAGILAGRNILMEEIVAHTQKFFS